MSVALYRSLLCRSRYIDRFCIGHFCAGHFCVDRIHWRRFGNARFHCETIAVLTCATLHVRGASRNCQRKKITRSPGHEKQQGRQLFLHELLVTASFFSANKNLVKMEINFLVTLFARALAYAILFAEVPPPCKQTHPHRSAITFCL